MFTGRTSVGLDVHARSVAAAAIDGVTGELFQTKLPPGNDRIVAWVDGLPGPVAVAYEAGPTGFGLYLTRQHLSGAASRAAFDAESDVAFLAFPYAPDHVLPARELAGKIVIDNNNNYMIGRDGRFPEVDEGRATVQKLRQRQLPDSGIVKAFSHIQFHSRIPLRVPSDVLPALVRLARPRGATDRKALSVSSDFPDAVAFVTRLYDDLGFDTVDNSPLVESWRSAPGTPAWAPSVDGQGRRELEANLRRAGVSPPAAPSGQRTPS